MLENTRHVIFEARTKELRKYGTSVAHSAVFNVILALGDDATPAEIARWLFRKPSTVSDLLGRMEKEGLIRRVGYGPGRSNLVKVQLTDKGLEAHNSTAKLETIHRILAVLSPEERDRLRTSLEKLWYRSLDELGRTHIPLLPGPQTQRPEDSSE